MKKSGFAAYVCAALLTLAGMLAGQPHQADAAPILETFSGTIASYSPADSQGFFGGGSLAGDAFTATYSYDPAQCSSVTSSEVNSCGTSITASFALYNAANSTQYNYSVTSTVAGLVETFQAGQYFLGLYIAETSGNAVNEIAFGTYSDSSLNILTGPTSDLDPTHFQQLSICAGPNGSNCSTLYGIVGAAAPAPEPASALLFGSGLLAAGAARRRKAG